MINGHGNDLYNYPGKIQVDFSSNIWFEGIPAQLKAHLKNEIDIIDNYPEPDSVSLANKISEFHNTAQNNTIVTNGSVEAFYLIAQSLAYKSATVITPTFSEYADACKIHNIEVEFLANDSITKDYKFKTTLVWLCNPNNPDGKVTPINTIKPWLKANPNTYFIIDEAYAELCTDFESAISLLQLHKNLIITKSFTKLFAIPGLRLGYILASTSIIKSIKKHQLPWGVNSLAISAGNYIIDNYNSLAINKEALNTLSQNLQLSLAKFPQIKVTKSNCNFFLVETLVKNAGDLKDYLANEHGFLIRDASNFYGLNKGHFRIAVQSENNNSKLVKAIGKWINL